MTKPAPISLTEAKSLFAGLDRVPALLLAVSGGPDSTALLVLAARWAKGLKKKPKLFAATVDHGLRADAKKEAAAAGKLAKQLRIAHRVLVWSGKKPSTGIQQNARQARYGLLADEARSLGATHVLTAHTLDDQAETVLIRMSRGSGMTGLSAMARRSRLDGLILVRPFLELSKDRLIATLRAAKIPYATDPSNADPKFTRVRVRGLMQDLAREGLDARRLAVLARRLRRADAALEAETNRIEVEIAASGSEPRQIAIPAGKFARLSAEIALRLLGRAIGQVGTEGPVELGKLEALFTEAGPALQNRGKTRFRRTLAGAIVTVADNEVLIEPAPPRRNTAGAQTLTKPGRRKGTGAKAR